MQRDRRRQAGDQMPAADPEGQLLLQRQRRADLDLDLLGRARADRQLVDVADVVRDRLVHLVAADPDRAEHDDPAERDHRHLRGAAADVDDEPADRLLDRQPGPDRGRDRLLDQVHLAGAGGQRRLFDRALLDLGHARRRADDQPRVRAAAVDHLADEVPQHLLGHLEVGDHAVAQRPRGRDRGGRATDHPLGLGADRVDLAGPQIGGDDRRLGHDDPLAADVHERVGGAEIDRHVVHAQARDQRASGIVTTGTVSAESDARDGTRWRTRAPALQSRLRRPCHPDEHVMHGTDRPRRHGGLMTLLLVLALLLTLGAAVAIWLDRQALSNRGWTNTSAGADREPADPHRGRRRDRHAAVHAGQRRPASCRRRWARSPGLPRASCARSRLGWR